MLDVLIIILEIVGLSIAYLYNNYGPRCFVFYTNLSNSFFTIGILINVIMIIRSLTLKKDIPHWCYIMKYIGLCHVCITFIIVVAIIAPGEAIFNHKNYFYQLTNKSFLFLHTICPALGFLNCVLFDRREELKARDIFIASTFMFLYSTIISIVCLTNLIEPPYIFLEFNNQPVLLSIFYYIFMNGFAVIFAFLLYKRNNHYFKKLTNQPV